MHAEQGGQARSQRLGVGKFTALCIVAAMARKVFQAHLGFFDTIVAAPSQTSALAAWGSSTNLFAMGLARVTDDPKAIAAAMAKPGIVLRRARGSDDPYSEHPDLPRLASKPKSKSKRR
jgi:hypothetical protein